MTRALAITLIMSLSLPTPALADGITELTGPPGTATAAAPAPSVRLRPATTGGASLLAQAQARATALAGARNTASPQLRPSSRSSASVAGWTAVGAGAGFGLGLYAGLAAFDDAIDSDRKVWTAAIASAAGGAVIGYLVGRARGHREGPGAVAAR
jgi:hypothetical protein